MIDNSNRIMWCGRRGSNSNGFLRWYLKPLEALSRGGGARNINNLAAWDEAGAPPDHARPLQEALQEGR